MRILGIDPGSEITGYGVIDSDGASHAVVDYGAIRAGSSRRAFHQRLLTIHDELCAVLQRAPVAAVAVEGMFHALNSQSALRLGHARGVALLAAARFGLPLFEYSPMEIKKAIVGYGRAEKGQVQGMVRFLLRLPEVPSPADAADALAVAICHAHHAGTRVATGGIRLRG